MAATCGVMTMPSECDDVIRRAHVSRRAHAAGYRTKRSQMDCVVPSSKRGRSNPSVSSRLSVAKGISTGLLYPTTAKFQAAAPFETHPAPAPPQQPWQLGTVCVERAGQYVSAGFTTYSGSRARAAATHQIRRKKGKKEKHTRRQTGRDKQIGRQAETPIQPRRELEAKTERARGKLTAPPRSLASIALSNSASSTISPRPTLIKHDAFGLQLANMPPFSSPIVLGVDGRTFRTSRRHRDCGTSA